MTLKKVMIENGCKKSPTYPTSLLSNVPMFLSKVILLLVVLRCYSKIFSNVIQCPSPIIILQCYHLLGCSPMHNVYIGQYDSPVSKNWNPKTTFPWEKNYFWGYFFLCSFRMKTLKLVSLFILRHWKHYFWSTQNREK